MNSPSSTANHEQGNQGQAFGSIFLHDVTRIDCAVFDPSKGVYGQTWKVDLSVSGNIGGNGFVFDFGKLKKMTREVLKSSIDHALVIPINSQVVSFRGLEKAECWKMKSRAARGGQESDWQYISPNGGVFSSRSVAVTRPVLEQEIIRSLRHRLPDEITQIAVQLREEEMAATEAVFRYTHGIAGHDGMCQRLMHGHRCRVQIYVGDERRPDWEHHLVRDVLGTSIHIATPSQFKSGHIEPGTRGTGPEPVTLGYQGSQGYFEATLPADRIFCVARETSIECITQEFARLIRREETAPEKIRVICYEGIDKGAVAELL